MTVDHIVYGVEEMLKFITDPAGIESRRPLLPPGGTRAIRTIDAREFPDGVIFQLDIYSQRPDKRAVSGLDAVAWELLARITTGQPNPEKGPNDLGIVMHWHSFELLPEEVLFLGGEGIGSEPETFHAETSRPWRLDVDVCQHSYPWIDRAGNSELRRVRSMLDCFARPRVILPATDVEGFRNDYVALIALFAGKAECFGRRDELFPQFFRSYCDSSFRRGALGRRLDETEWHGIVDRVYERLFSGIVGMGFTMPAFPGSFRAYVSRAIRGEAASLRSRDPRILKPGQFPPTIGDAAASLGISHMTVRRRMSGLGFTEWTEQAWEAVSATISTRKGWQEVLARLQASGLRAETARKRVQRWRGSGTSLSEAFRQSSPAKLPRGTCASCKEEHAAGALHNGKFLCGACFAEIAGCAGC